MKKNQIIMKALIPVLFLKLNNNDWLVGFNCISTSIGYLMPKPVYTYVRFVDT